MEVRKIVLRQSEVHICKLLAAAGLEEEQAEAEAKGEPFDYEAIKAEREKEFIRLYAEQKRKKEDWEASRDKAFHDVIGEITQPTKLYNYIQEHVRDLKTLREMDPADVLKVGGYGKKTADQLRELQERIRKHPKILTRINKAMEVQRRMNRHMDEYRDAIYLYNRLRSDQRHTRNHLLSTWKYYGGQ